MSCKAAVPDRMANVWHWGNSGPAAEIAPVRILTPFGHFARRKDAERIAPQAHSGSREPNRIFASGGRRHKCDATEHVIWGRKSPVTFSYLGESEATTNAVARSGQPTNGGSGSYSRLS